MAAGDFLTFRLWNADGSAKTDALANGLAFTAYRNRSGTARTPPTITHLGSGVYRFQPTTSDVAEGIAYAISSGTGAYPARLYGAIHTDEQPFAAFLLTTQADGSLWAGAAPTVAFYVDPAGVARTSPGLVAVAGAYLYTITPSAADLAVGVAGLLSMPVGADPSPAPPFSFAVSSDVDPAASTGPALSPQFPQTIAYAEVSSRDLAARATLGSVATTAARVQSTHQFVRDHAGESFQAAYMIHAPANCPVGQQHRLWLPSEGDTTGVTAQSRRIIKVEKLREGSGAVRFLRIYCF